MEKLLIEKNLINNIIKILILQKSMPLKRYYIYELSEISEECEFDFLLNDKAIYKNEGIDRVVITSLEYVIIPTSE